MTAIDLGTRAERLPAYALFAAFLAAAGLPLYIHAPKVFVDNHGVSLAALGSVLFGLRLLDVVQDPLLGRLAEATRHARAVGVGVAIVILVGAMIGLFVVAPPVAPLLWFAMMLLLVFSAYSFLTICFYAQGVQKAEGMGETGYLRLARWRETGALLGVCVASVAPVMLGFVMDRPFAGFAAGFAVLGLAALHGMRGEWDTEGQAPSAGLRPVLADRTARRLLVIGLLNAAPVAVSSTLFLFFVESRLAAPGAEGWLLLLFFLSAAVAASLWARAAERFGAKMVLLAGMVLSICAFGFAITLEAGDVAAFAAICIVSGAALGADLTLLPAIFAKRMAQIAPSGADGFGLWSFVSKFALAFAAVTLLPALEGAGFSPGIDNPAEALWMLSLLYAGVPCILKVIAIVMLMTTHLEEI